MIKYTKDGKKYYYYYKKKHGRHKKTGKKHKLKKRGRSWQKKWNFKIVKCTFNKQDEFIGVYHDVTEVEKVKNLIENENRKVIFPIKYVNSSRIKNDRYSSTEYKSEYVILERINDENRNTQTKLRDKYGRFVTQTTDSEIWKIYDKIPYVKEETFWVYGYNPQNDRKTFTWIYENLIINRFIENRYLVVQIFVFKNKLIFLHDSILENFVICKNHSDAVRLYNALNNKTIEDKLKRCYFSGEFTVFDETGKVIIKKMLDLTGWDITKIRQSYT